jgi:hypothetical protein
MEAVRQRVEEEAADELACFKRHALGLGAVAIILTWGVPGQGGDSFMRAPAHLVSSVSIFRSYPGPEPDCLMRPVSERDQPHIRSPLETAAPTSRLLRAGAQANETILPIGISGQGLPRFVHPDPPELIRSWKICEFV